MPSFLQQLMAQLAGLDNPVLPPGPAYGPAPGTLTGPGGDLYGMIPVDTTQGGMAANYLGANNQGLGPMGGGPWDQGIGLSGRLQFNPNAVLDPSQVTVAPPNPWFANLPRGMVLPPGMSPPSPYPMYDPIEPGASPGYPWGPNWDYLINR